MIQNKHLNPKQAMGIFQGNILPSSADFVKVLKLAKQIEIGLCGYSKTGTQPNP
jgi:hypothetical protein